MERILSTTMKVILSSESIEGAYAVVQFYAWFKFYFPLFLGMVMYDNE